MLQSFDMFKGSPEIRFKGQKGGYSSWFGQITTIVVLALGISLLVYFSLDMILKTNPLIQIVPSSEIEDIRVTDESFPFAFGLLDANGNFYIDERIYSVKGRLENSQLPFDVVPCRPTQFEGYYDPENDGPLWCFAEQQSQGSQLKISSADALTINFQKCDRNETSNCFDEDDIDNLLFDNHIKVFRKEFGYNVDNYQNPITERTITYTASIATTMIKESYLYVTRNHYSSDDGWLFNHIKRDTRINVVSVIQYFEDKEVMGNVFTQIGLDTSGQSTRFIREYDKVPNIFARWDVMFTIMIIAGKLLSDAYNSFKTQEALMKDIFYVKNNKSRAQNVRSRTNEELEAKKIIRSSNLKSPSTAQEVLNTIQSQVENSYLHRNFSDKGAETQRSEITSADRLISYPDQNLDTARTEPDEKVIIIQRVSDQNRCIRGPSSGTTEYLSPKKFEVEQVNNDDESALDTNDIYKEKDLEAKNDDNQNNINNQNSSQIRKENININTTMTLKQKMKTKFKASVRIMKKPSRLVRKYAMSELAEDEPPLGFWAWFCSKIKKTSQYKLFLQREQIIQKEFDFQSHAKRFIEIDVLKYLLFTKDQLVVFDNCVKAYVNSKLDAAVKDKKLEDYGKVSYGPDEEDDALVNLKQATNPDETTKKIIHLLGELFTLEEKDA